MKVDRTLFVIFSA